MSNYEDLKQRATDLLAGAEPGPWSVAHDYGKNCIVTTYDGYQHLIGTGWGELAEADAALIAAAPTLLAECVSRITELEAEVATRVAHEERLFRAYLRVQGIPDDEIDAEITRKAVSS